MNDSAWKLFRLTLWISEVWKIEQCKAASPLFACLACWTPQRSSPERPPSDRTLSEAEQQAEIKAVSLRLLK